MAAPVNYDSEALHVEVARLFMECRVRAEREDQLMNYIKELQAKIAELESAPKSRASKVVKES